MKKNLSLIFFAAISFIIAACSGSLPACDSKEVRDVLNKIARDSDLTLVGLNGITTLSKSKKTCTCAAIGIFSDGSQREEIPIEYTVDLADNGKEILVTIGVR